MARQKFDGVVEAAHLLPDGALDWVRVYERRGPTFSDLTRIDRTELIKRLKMGKKYVLGCRIPFRASEFETSQALRLFLQDGKEHIALEGVDGFAGDNLIGIPVV